MTSAVHPQRLTTVERLDEVGRILAAGILRSRARRLQSQAQSNGQERESSLDFTANESGHVRTETRHGEKR